MNMSDLEVNNRELSNTVLPLNVTYKAVFDEDKKRFTVHAFGFNNTTGYKTFFQVDPRLILPAIVDFINLKPTGMVGEMITPFHVQIGMVAADSVFGENQQIVTINDIEGDHQIQIEDAPSSK
jgi:hypothetical protein